MLTFLDRFGYFMLMSCSMLLLGRRAKASLLVVGLDEPKALGFKQM